MYNNRFNRTSRLSGVLSWVIEMKAQNVPCKKCGWVAEIYGSDDHNTEGPWFCECCGCGYSTDLWAYQREAWAQWKIDNQKIHKDR